MQAGHEKTLTALLPALAGANMIYGLGMLEMGMTLSYGQLVADNEFAAMIRRVLEGIPVNDEDLAVDVITRVGARGHFLTEEHTLKYMRGYQSQPKLIDRNMRDFWLDKGAVDLTTRANEVARGILETHQPKPLPSSVVNTLRSLVEDAEKVHGLR
jgi:trimethylamine--corrinoid protein Co-methyltransferase